MALLHCSNTLLKQLDAMPESGEPPPSAQGRLGDWCAAMLSLGKRRAVLFMNQRTQLSFIILEGQRFDAKAIAEVFWGGLSRVLELHEVKASTSEKVIASYKELVLAPTPSASLTAHMKNLARDYKQLVEIAGGIEHCSISTIIHSLNQRPRKSLNWSTPTEVMRDLINATITH
jgi:hypothetical protein